MYACMYVCMCMYVCVYMYVCMCICMYVYVCIYIYIYIYILLYHTLYTVLMFVPTSALKSTISVSYFDTGAGILFGWWLRTCAKIPFIETIFQV